jgi:streptogramin lyase
VRIRLAIGAVLLALAALPAAAAQAEPIPAGAQGYAQSFPTKCGVEDLAAGREGNVWFACIKGLGLGFHSRTWVGLVTPAGQVSEFGVGQLPKDLEPAAIAVAPDGDLWVGLDAYYQLYGGERPPPLLAQVTPTGQVTTFPIPLGRKWNIGSLAVGPGGAVYFTTATGDGAGATKTLLWTRTADGTISQLPASFPVPTSGLTTGPEGDLWYAAKPTAGAAAAALVRVGPGNALSEIGADVPGFNPGAPIFGKEGPPWYVIRGDKSATAGRIGPAGEVIPSNAEIKQAGSAVSGATVGSDGNLWLGIRIGSGTSGIERVTPTGEATEFTQCQLYSQPYFGPNQLVTGGDGNVYWTSIASRSLPNITDPPSIGRITPSGEATQIFAGVVGEPRFILAGPDGAIWFSSGAAAVQRIAPATGPINTFRVSHLKRGSAKTGASKAVVTVPSAGAVSLQPLAFLPRHSKPVPVKAAPVTGTATACSAVTLPLAPAGAAKSAFHRRGFASERVAVTFTPTGGTPYTETVDLEFFGGKRHEKGSKHKGSPPPGKHKGEPLRVPQAGRNFPVRPPVLRFAYQPPGSYGDDETNGRPVYPPFTLTGLGHWKEWHKNEERNGVPARAIADGFIHYDTCDPNCAHGRYAVARAHVELDGENLCTKGRDRIFETFERITVRVEGGPPRTRFIQCTGRLRSGKRSQVIPPGVGFY